MNRRLRIAPLAVAVVLALAGAACGDQDTFLVTGKIQLDFEQMDWDTASFRCWGKGRYSDLAPGTQVTVKDPAGEVIAVGQIDEGETEGRLPVRGCQLSFAASDVPAGKNIYSLTFGNRTPMQYREEQLTKPITLTIQ